VLNLADHIVFDLRIPFRKIRQQLFVRTFHHLAEHLDVLLALLNHVFHVYFDFSLEQFDPLVGL